MSPSETDLTVEPAVRRMRFFAHSRGLMAAVLVVIGVAAGPTGMALAVTADEAARPGLVQALAPQLNPTERAAVMAALDLPEGTRLSALLLDAAVPGRRPLALRLRGQASREANAGGPWHRAAARFARLESQVAPPPPVPVLGPFSSARYREAVAMLAGQGSRPWPGNPARQARFTNRLLGHPGNQLEELVDYLKAYYAALGLKTEEQRFTWGGQTYRNLAAVIPGQSPEAVLLADHIDAAATANYDDATLWREAPQYGLSAAKIAALHAGHRAGAPVPGADDNASATAALMEAAHMLQGKRPAKTIKLLHLNGEEFPGDDAGARHYAALAMASGTPIAGVVVMDMIGVNRQQDRVFQIAVGRHPASAAIADMALAASRQVATGYSPRLRGFRDPGAYLYNTDGQIFSAAGYPVVLLNEHLNYDRDLERLGYHDEFDRTELFDWPYAQAVASVGIATALQLAETTMGPCVATGRTPECRVAHFTVELGHSELMTTVNRFHRNMKREPTDTELARLITADQTSADPETVTKRLTTWFPEAKLAPIDAAAIAAEIRYLRARRVALGAPAIQ